MPHHQPYRSLAAAQTHLRHRSEDPGEKRIFGMLGLGEVDIEGGKINAGSIRPSATYNTNDEPQPPLVITPVLGRVAALLALRNTFAYRWPHLMSDEGQGVRSPLRGLWGYNSSGQPWSVIARHAAFSNDPEDVRRFYIGQHHALSVATSNVLTVSCDPECLEPVPTNNQSLPPLSWRVLDWAGVTVTGDVPVEASTLNPIFVLPQNVDIRTLWNPEGVLRPDCPVLGRGLSSEEIAGAIAVSYAQHDLPLTTNLSDSDSELGPGVATARKIVDAVGTGVHPQIRLPEDALQQSDGTDFYYVAVPAAGAS